METVSSFCVLQLSSFCVLQLGSSGWTPQGMGQAGGPSRWITPVMSPLWLTPAKASIGAGTLPQCIFAMLLEPKFMAADICGAQL